MKINDAVQMKIDELGEQVGNLFLEEFRAQFDELILPDETLFALAREIEAATIRITSAALKRV